MRKVTLVLLALGLVVATAAFASNPVRISQVYGAGGNTYKCDYVELFNSSNAPVNIGGWSVQYGSATGSSFGSSTYNYALIPAGATIPACGYYLITGACSTAGGNLPLTPDLTIPGGGIGWQFNFSATSGKVALFNDQVFNRSCAQAQAVAIDIVGYGGANCYETAPAVAGDNFSALVRAGAGMVDTDNNSSDISKVAQPVTIHNSSSPPNPDCVPPIGACCLRNTTPGACIVVTAAECQAQGGIFIGIGSTCQPNPPCVVPSKPTTWGKVKTIYR